MPGNILKELECCNSCCVQRWFSSNWSRTDSETVCLKDGLVRKSRFEDHSYNWRKE